MTVTLKVVILLYHIDIKGGYVLQLHDQCRKQKYCLEDGRVSVRQ